MGKKYIVEIGRCERLYKAYINGNGKPNLTWLSPEVDLTPYTEPDLERVKKTAHDDGYSEGYQAGRGELNRVLSDVESDVEQVRLEAEQLGMVRAWDAVRKIEFGTDNGGIPTSIMEEIFGTPIPNRVLRDFTAADVIEKLKAYEQEQEEIKVGDEVELKCGVRPAIYMQGTKGSDEIYLLFNDGSCGVHSKSEIVRKTGRHFHEIATILENMRGEQDG